MPAHQVMATVRKKLGLSQAEVALSIGKTERTYRAWEKGESKPNAAKLHRFAKAVKMPSWEHAVAFALGPARPHGHRPSIPVLANVPASFGGDSEVEGGYGYEEAVDYIALDRVDDPASFGLTIEGESMSPEYSQGDQIICSPTHWRDHGFIDGGEYAIRFTEDSGGGTTFKRVHIIDDDRLELVPINPKHATQRVYQRDVQFAAIVTQHVINKPLPDLGGNRRT